MASTEFTVGVSITNLAGAASPTDTDNITTAMMSPINFNTASSPVASSPAASSSDFDGDGMVGTADFLLFAYHFGSSLGDGTYQAKYDLDGNGVIGLSDVLIFVDNFGQQVPPSGGGGGGGSSGIPDLIVESPSVSDNTLTTGQSFTLSATVRNQGTRSSASTTLRYYHSSNATISSSDTEVGTDSVNGLSASGTSAESISLNAPSSAGTYYYGACVASVSGESDTNNNCSTGVRVTVSSSSGGATVTIADANLRAVISDSLGKSRNVPITRSEMARLTHLDARNKGIRNLTGLEHATNLRWLYLGRVWVSGELVNSNDISNLSPLSRLTNLKVLDLTSNSISSISAVSNLIGLTSLSLGDNNISDISALSRLTNLEILHIWGNSISDISAVSNLIGLTYLSLGDNNISDISALSNLIGLTYLSLVSNSISDISALSRLTNLEILYIWGNSISDISVLSRLTNLKELYTGSNSISDISSLSGLTNLTMLYLDRNSISDISSLSGLTNLTMLYLYRNSISDISPLVANTGLGSGDTVDLKSNPLSNASINTHIPALQRRGVTVEFDSSSGSGGSSNSPDLIVESPSVSDNALTSGQSFTLSATVRNQGTGTSASTTLRYYQSSNSTISTSDTEVGKDSVGGLSASGTSAESISLNAPSSAGTYYYGACVNSVTGEFDIGNNCSDAVAVTVSSSSSGGGGGSHGACRAGLVVNPNESCTYKGFTFSVSSSGRGSIAFFSAGTGIDARGSTINGVSWNFHATKNSGSNSWTIHTAD